MCSVFLTGFGVNTTTTLPRVDLNMCGTLQTTPIPLASSLGHPTLAARELVLKGHVTDALCPGQQVNNSWRLMRSQGTI